MAPLGHRSRPPCPLASQKRRKAFPMLRIGYIAHTTSRRLWRRFLLLHVGGALPGHLRDTRGTDCVCTPPVTHWCQQNACMETETSDRPAPGAIGQSREFEGKDHATKYSTLRPVCGPDVVDTILGYCKETLGTQRLKLALDLGCGSGQSTEPLAPYFDQVIGVEISPNQLTEAQKRASKPSNVNYRLGPAEDLSFQPDESVDLIIVGQALHWFEFEPFYQEVRRVLRPGGVFSAYGYNTHRLDKDEATALVEKVYMDPLGPFWHEKIRLLEDKYINIPALFGSWKRIEHLRIEERRTLTDAMHYFTSWSAYQSHMRKHPESTLLKDLEEKFLDIYEDCGAKSRDSSLIDVTMTFPIILIIAQKPPQK